VVAAVLAMVLNRLMSPCSKLGVSRWIEEVEEPTFTVSFQGEGLAELAETYNQ